MFGKHWTAAQAVVVDKRALKNSGDGMVTVYEYVVDVTTETGEVFRAKAEEPRIAIDFRTPSIGHVVRVEYDPGSRKVRFDKDDPSNSMKAFAKARDDHFAESLAQPPGTPPAAPVPFGVRAPGSPDISQITALLQAQAGQAQVVQLGADSPEANALREALLRAMGGVPAPEPPAETGTTA
jgi:hypothetical protein